jgi:hypothetical protein
MVIDEIKTADKKEALAILGKHLDSPELLYASMECLDGEYAIKIQRPTHTCGDEEEATARIINAS